MFQRFRIQILAPLAILAVSLPCSAGQFVKLTMELSGIDWGWHWRLDANDKRSQYEADHLGPLMPGQVFECVVGSNCWLISRHIEDKTVQYWFTGTQVIEQYVAPNQAPFRHAFASEDGNPGRPVRVADLITMYSPGRVCWLAYCSGAALKTPGRHLYPPDDVWKESSLIAMQWTDNTRVFDDTLGLPKSVTLTTTTGQTILEYHARGSTNVAGWNFPLEFSLIQYLPTAANGWKANITATGKLLSISPTNDFPVAPQGLPSEKE